MNVIFNASILSGPRTGIGNYAYELIGALSRLENVEVNTFGVSDYMRGVYGLSASRVQGFNALARNLPGAYQLRRVIKQRAFDLACDDSEPDVYHEPSLWPLEYAGPKVMTICDLTHIKYPETQPAARIRAAEKYCRRGIDAGATIVTISQFVAREISNHYAIDHSRIFVTPLAASDRFVMRSSDDVSSTLRELNLAYKSFFLCLSTIEPRKNLEFSLLSHQLMPEGVRRKYPLVIVGASGWLIDSLKPFIAKGVTEGSVMVLGYVHDETIIDLLSSATALLFPSKYEGFGLPVIEAMACGLPVLAPNNSAIPEVAGEAAEYIDLNDPKSCSELMLCLAEDARLCSELSRKGREQSKLFSWEACARKTVDAYQHAITAFRT